MIPGYEKLINEIDTRLTAAGIAPEEITLDHIGYRVASSAEFERLKSEIKDAELVHQNEVSGRMVVIFKFLQPVVHGRHQILGFEVVAPKAGEAFNTSWDHVEYIPNCSLVDFVTRHPEVSFDQTALNRPEFAKVAIRYDDGLSAKFHTETVLEEISKM